METAKTLYDEDLTFNTDQWSADWSANMSGDGEESNAVVAYMGCPWFVYWSSDRFMEETTPSLFLPRQNATGAAQALQLQQIVQIPSLQRRL